jgi:hypothetical protein
MNFHPTTARFLKMAWADIQMDELKVATDWAIASTVLSVVSIIDITGVTGVVAAYAKPICGDVVNFPCIEARVTACG